MDDFGMPSDFDFKGLSLIDVSSEDDCLIGFPFFDSISPHSSGKGTENKTTRFSLDPGNVEISSGFLEEAGELEEPPGSSEHDKRKNRKNNLRKNFTWDNAFFASAGFLESEDWSSMVGGNENGEIHILPGIQEDVNGYFESLMTLELLDGETLTLEDPGADLFEDIRASIQEFSKTPNTANSSVRKVRSSGRSTNMNMLSYSGVPGGSPKSGAKCTSPTGSSNSAKIGKLQRVRTFTAIQSPDFDVKQTSSLVRSIPSLSNQKPSNAATKVLSAPRNNPKSSTVTFPTLQNKSSPRAFRESDLEDQGVGGRIKDTKIVPLDGVLQTADNLTSMTMEKAAEKGSDSGPYCKTRTLSLHNTNQEEAPVKNSGIMEVDINSDTHKECISDYHFAHGQKELMNSLSNPTACCPVSSEITYGLRKPFSVKDSFYNIDAPLEGLSGTAPVVDKTTVLQIPESAVPENS